MMLSGCGPEPEYMEATIDGALWQAEDITCIYRTSSPSALEVWGSRTLSGDTVRFLRLLNLPPTAPNTVPLAASDGPRASIADGVVFDETTVGFSTTDEFTGTVTITEFDLGSHRCSVGRLQYPIPNPANTQYPRK